MEGLAAVMPWPTVCPPSNRDELRTPVFLIDQASTTDHNGRNRASTCSGVRNLSGSPTLAIAGAIHGVRTLVASTVGAPILRLR